MVVVFSGGGTGGHLYPALALAEGLQTVRGDVEPFFVGAKRGIEHRILPERGLRHLLVDVEGFRRSLSLENVMVVARLMRGFFQVRRAFRAERPRAVVVTGGYASAPAGLAAAAMGIPLVVQEQNETPGVTTRLLARWAQQIHLAYPEAKAQLSDRVEGRIHESGNPVRPPFPINPVEARKTLGLPVQGPVVLVVGGSQGSKALNDLLVSVAEDLGALPANILWATGTRHFDDVSRALGPRPENLVLVPYLDDMPLALAVADLAVSRAGAMTTSEFLAWGIPSILVPLPTAAADHQRRNALALQAAGVAVCLEQETTSGATVLSVAEGLITDTEERALMRNKALERARPSATTDIATAIATLLPEAA